MPVISPGDNHIPATARSVPRAMDKYQITATSTAPVRLDLPRAVKFCWLKNTGDTAALFNVSTDNGGDLTGDSNNALVHELDAGELFPIAQEEEFTCIHVRLTASDTVKFIARPGAGFDN